MGQLMAHEAAGKLEHIEVLGYLFLLAIAGNETTTKLIGNFTWLLWANPDERARVAADRALCAGAVEETLRMDGPTQMQARETSQDTELHGAAPSPADRRWRSSSPPPTVTTPTTRPRTSTASIVARATIWASAVVWHSCLGAALARLEGRIALEEMLDVMPDWAVDESGTCWMHSAYVRGYTHLPITFMPEPADGDIEFTYVHPDGAEQTIAVEEGTTLMEAAIFNGIDGIQGLCGGICSCATCHVALDQDVYDRLPAPDEGEAEMIDMLDEHRPTSRLGCQVRVDEGLRGARVHVIGDNG
ncbi:2Fe-2S iron-sulfur cluster-binding protein [Sphingomonas sp. MMS24-JH45]